MSTNWNLFDPEVDIKESFRDLPHRDQAGALTFVTMRLADSMPVEVVKKWHQEIEAWLIENQLGGKSVDQVLNSQSLNPKLKQELRQFRQRRWHGYLDECHGECWFKRPGLANEVAESILHFNKTRYDVERFIVMPNHAHVLIQMQRGFDLRKSFREIQRFSARQINRLVGRRGELWQGEPFDHLVRSDRQFEYLQNYILENPLKANLREGEYLFWRCS